MIVVVAGCLPQPPTAELPKSFIESSFATGASTFTVQTPPAGLTGQDVVADLAQRRHPMFQGRAVPVFGVVDCHGSIMCIPGPADVAGGRGTVWVLLYPDCKDPTGDFGWAVVDAVKGAAAGYTLNDSCSR